MTHSVGPGGGWHCRNQQERREALARLEAMDPRKAEIVMLRYFAGLSEEETGAALEVSVRTIEREWRYIRVWLYSS